MADAALHVVVRGVVQGVGFRDATKRRADELGVRGWVLNRDDGAVEVHAEAATAALDAFAAFLAAGPPGARVDGLEQLGANVEGHEQFAVRGVPHGRFVLQAGDRGSVLRLEVGGAMRAWVLPKGPPSAPGERRMAVEVDDPGEGGVEDTGPYEQRGRVPWPEALDRGHAMVLLHGEHVRGGFALQRTRERQWLMVRRKD